MLVALSFSSITCFRIVRDDLMASFNVMDCELTRERRTNRTENLLQFIQKIYRLKCKTAAYTAHSPAEYKDAAVPCGKPPAESSALPRMPSRWPEHHTAQRFLMDPCGTWIHPRFKKNKKKKKELGLCIARIKTCNCSLKCEVCNVHKSLRTAGVLFHQRHQTGVRRRMVDSV